MHLSEARCDMTISLSRLRIGVAAVVAAIVASALAPGGGAERPAYASTGISQRLGFDSCMPTIGQLQAFWNNTPFSNFGLYIGGADLGCATPNASYASQVLAMG